MRKLELMAATVAATLTLSAAPSVAQELSLPAPLQCIEDADDRTLLTEADTQRLCDYTPSPAGPVDCYVAGDDQTTLSNVQLIELCRCALDASPVACFVRAEDETDLFQDKIIAMCAPVTTRKLSADCSPRAF